MRPHVYSAAARRCRHGFALPMTILVIAFLSAATMAAFARTGAEVRIVDSHQAQKQAFALANAGLELYLATGRLAALDTTYALPGGHAIIRVDTVRRATAAGDSGVFLVRSRGITTASGPGRPPAARVVAQFAVRPPTQVQVLASWTSLSGLLKNGSSGVVSGFDACAGGTTALPGVALPTNTYVQQGSGTVLAGNPAMQPMGTQQQMASQINIDWPGIRHPTAPSIPPDVVYCRPATYGYDAARGPCGAFPSGSTFSGNGSYWPVILVNGSTTLPANGRGFLIVTGDLTFGGNDQWDGIIMVGGRIIDNGSGNIAGAVITGLNVLLGETVAQSSQANGTKDYQYDSCKVAAATASAGRLHGVRNAWTDSWLTW
jgi:hypothetical protein